MSSNGPVQIFYKAEPVKKINFVPITSDYKSYRRLFTTYPWCSVHNPSCANLIQTRSVQRVLSPENKIISYLHSCMLYAEYSSIKLILKWLAIKCYGDPVVVWKFELFKSL